MTARDALTLVSRRRRGESEVVSLRDGDENVHRMTIERYMATDAARLTCLARTTSPVPQFRVVQYERD